MAWGGGLQYLYPSVPGLDLRKAEMAVFSQEEAWVGRMPGLGRPLHWYHRLVLIPLLALAMFGTSLAASTEAQASTQIYSDLSRSGCYLKYTYFTANSYSVEDAGCIRYWGGSYFYIQPSRDIWIWRSGWVYYGNAYTQTVSISFNTNPSSTYSLMSLLAKSSGYAAW